MLHFEFNGINFYQTTPKDYCRHSVGHTTILMHKYVWEYYNGKIPKGYEVHHIDGDRANNDISNLQLLTREEHKKLHAKQLTTEQREWRRTNLNTTARPKAVEWHKSEEGRKWHEQQVLTRKDNRTERVNICSWCGKEFTTFSNRDSQYCSGACKAAQYRMTHPTYYHYQRCVICDTLFLTDGIAQCCSRSCSAKWRWKKKKDNKDYGLHKD